MSANKRISKVLAMLLPTGVLGISSALAATQVRPEPAPLAGGLAPPTLRTGSPVSVKLFPTWMQSMKRSPAPR